jgi:hypothetical protein
MTLSRSVKTEPSTGNTSLDGSPRGRRAPPRSTKSLDGHEFRNQLGRNRVFSFDKIDVSSGKRSTASNTSVSAKVKDSPSEASSESMQAQPESFASTITGFRSLQLEPSTAKTSRNGPNWRRAPPQSTKSLDRNEFRSQLGHNQVFSLGMMGNDRVNLGTVANAPTSDKLKSSPPATILSKSMQAQPESFENTITWSRSLQPKPTTKNTSRDGPPDAPHESTKSLDGNEFRIQSGHNRVFSLDMIGDGSDKCGTVSITLASATPKSSLSTASSKSTQAQPESFENTITWSRSLQPKPTTKKTFRDGKFRRRAPPKSITRRKSQRNLFED